MQNPDVYNPLTPADWNRTLQTNHGERIHAQLDQIVLNSLDLKPPTADYPERLRADLADLGLEYGPMEVMSISKTDQALKAFVETLPEPIRFSTPDRILWREGIIDDLKEHLADTRASLYMEVTIHGGVTKLLKEAAINRDQYRSVLDTLHGHDYFDVWDHRLVNSYRNKEFGATGTWICNEFQKDLGSGFNQLMIDFIHLTLVGEDDTASKVAKVASHFTQGHHLVGAMHTIIGPNAFLSFVA